MSPISFQFVRLLPASVNEIPMHQETDALLCNLRLQLPLQLQITEHSLRLYDPFNSDAVKPAIYNTARATLRHSNNVCESARRRLSTRGTSARNPGRENLG
jgi:hypothetical protein